MSVGVITFTYNEKVNLPIWLRHYGSNFGEENLYVADRGSDDGSIDNIGKANLFRLPRNEFDEYEKTDFINHLQASLLNFYDVVIVTDCDEILIPDPQKYANLRHYVEQMKVPYVRAVGMDVIHMITEEPPLDLSQSILAQRSFGRFSAPESKCLVSKEPIRWLPGLHSCDKQAAFDPDFYCFHLKLMDYAIAVDRQKINVTTTWSKRSLDENLGAHHRYDLKTFVTQSFCVPIDLNNRRQIGAFEFGEEIEQITSGTKFANGMYYIPMDISRYVRIPRRFAACL